MAAATQNRVIDGSVAGVRSVLADRQRDPDPDTLRPLVIDAYACACVQAQKDVAATSKADNVGLNGLDWSTWEPGDIKAAEKILAGATDAEQLQGLLDAAGVTISSVASNRMDDLARALADAIGEGATIGELADELASILDDPLRAEMVARTETTRVMVAGAIDTYLDGGVGWVQCLSAEDQGVCPDCRENEEAGVLSIWATPPNGWPPAHPNCRCTVLPALGPNG